YQGAQPELVQGVQPDGLATGKPKIRHVYMAAPDVLALVVDAQAMPALPVLPYVPQPGDTIRRTRPQNYGTHGHQFFWGRDIIRDGKNIGQLVGPKEDHYKPAFQLLGEPLDVAWAESPASYALAAEGAAGGAASQTPVAVFRKSKPQMLEWTGRGKEEGTARHEIFLKFPHPLTSGQRYTLDFRGASQFGNRVAFTFDDTRLRTEAIQVNQAGYHPRQSEKVARLFQWLGNGGGVDFSGFKNFQLVDGKSGQTAFRGEIKLRSGAVADRKMAPEGTADPGDTMPAAVYDLDFSAFSQPGAYRVVVPGLGTSFPFRIDDNVWTDAARVSARGYLSQRSGIALGPPYTSYKRPRNMHPADGFPVYRTDPAIFFDPARFDNKKGGGNAFARIQASILEDQTEPNAWGGWHDAADYDRSILPQNHPRAVHAMLDLYESNPAYFEKLNLNLPESGNAIPDIMDEALWCMDLFLRIQQPDGGVPSAVESIEHPSEPSYLLKQPTAITPPPPQTCHVYAAAAARLSLALEKYDATRAKSYRESALRAMAWAARNPQVPNIYGNSETQANLAAFWMWRLTGDAKWHEEFQSTLKTLYPDGNLAKAKFDGPSAIAGYALLPTGQGDAALQQQCRLALLKAADAKAAAVSRRIYGVGPERYEWDERLGQSWELVAAHRLTGDRKYLAAMERLAQFALGLNPFNASYTTGIGSRQVVPFNFEAHYLGLPYPEGITT
ncbi:MAG: glycoside hydrolase family 9 protein, partial [Armatimonadota bacterium]|nr:glycoside hydrolase family 9 protein [Armatimonadota bacterium]